MRFASLGSGSRGNATLVEVKQTLVMIDNGFSIQETERRLATLNKTPDQLTAILVTHEHGDHITGVGRLARKYKIPVWMTEGTRRAAARHINKLDQLISTFNSHNAFNIDDLQIDPITVPHDAKEPAQFVFSDGDARLGILTDTGSITPHIIEMLTACNSLLVESNHDEDMLEASEYPFQLKQRISGRLGHLGNQQTAELLRRLDTDKLTHLIAAHLSEQNNAVSKVKRCLAEALSCSEDWIGIADQETGFAWRDVA